MSVLGSVVQSLVAVAKADFGAKVLPLIATAAQNMASNPTALNIAAQLTVLNAGILGAAPSLIQDELKALADAISNAVVAEQQALSAPK